MASSEDAKLVPGGHAFDIHVPGTIVWTMNGDLFRVPPPSDGGAVDVASNSYVRG